MDPSFSPLRRPYDFRPPCHKASTSTASRAPFSPGAASLRNVPSTISVASSSSGSRRPSRAASARSSRAAASNASRNGGRQARCQHTAASKTAPEKNAPATNSENNRALPARQHQNADTADAVSAIETESVGGSGRNRPTAEPERRARLGSAAIGRTRRGPATIGASLRHDATKSRGHDKALIFEYFVSSCLRDFVLFGGGTYAVPAQR